MRNALLGIDIGTGSIKAALLSENAEVMATDSREYPILRPNEGWAEVDADAMWKACVTAVRTVMEAAPGIRVAAIGICSLCPGLTALGWDGEVLQNPIIYSDARSVAQADYIREATGEETIFKITGNGVMSGAISGTSMLWIKNNRPDVYEKTRYFGHINTLVAFRLTGNYAMDPSNASYTSFFETAGSLSWSTELCAAAGIDIDKLPPLLSSHEIVGLLNNSELIGCGIKAGTPVVIGGGDTACSALAVGVYEDGQVFESAGTTNVLTVCVDRPVFDRAFINRCHVAEGRWIYQGALSHTGLALRWFRDEFCADLKLKAKETGRSVFALMDEEAAKSCPGAGGLVFLPYMAGERSPIWDPYARGVFFGLSFDTSRRDMIRAVLEGCGYGLRQLSELAENVTGNEIKSFTSVGGGSKSLLWAQIKADITGKEIELLDMNDAAVVGAALLGGVGVQMFSSIADACSKVEKKVRTRITPGEFSETLCARYEVYRGLYPRIKDMYRKNLCK